MDSLTRLGLSAYVVPLGVDHGLKPSDVGASDFIIALDRQALIGLSWLGVWWGKTIVLYNFREIGEKGGVCFNSWRKGWDLQLSAVGNKVKLVLDYHPHGAPYLSELGLSVAFCPLGYSKCFEIKESGDSCFDAVFLGQIFKSGRRKSMLRAMGEDVNLLVYSDGDAGIGINRAMRCRLWLNLHRSPKSYNFADIRVILYGMSNQLCVVTEPCSWAPPFVSDVHWTVLDSEQYALGCKTLLASDEKRRWIAKNAYEFIQVYWRFDDHVKTALCELGLL